VGRNRTVIEDEISANKLTQLIKARKFKSPLDGEVFKSKITLIKPHGDMCTYLMGKNDIYYRGIRHSQTTSALFPEKLSDITEKDNYVRTSIMPPTNSKRRHSSVFYDDELLRLKKALSESAVFIIIGWSAAGADEYYNYVFHDTIDCASEIFIIDKNDTRLKIQELFGSKAQLMQIQTDGFTEASVQNLRQAVLRE
jgi:hypothetical protein